MMKANFDIAKTAKVTEQDLKDLLASLLKVQIPQNLTRPGLVYGYLCEQMRVVHEFFVEKLGNQDTLVRDVIQWMSLHSLLDTHSQEWLAVEQHMAHVVDLSENCLTLLLVLSKRKASDTTFSWTGQCVGRHGGYKYLCTATENTPDGISVRDPFVVLYSKTKMA